MKKATTYPLNVALDLSPELGAILETENLCVQVAPKPDWRVSVRIGAHVTHLIYQTREACMNHLQLQAYPIDDGWLPASPTQTGNNKAVLTAV
jgi:hypothetical protein